MIETLVMHLLCKRNSCCIFNFLVNERNFLIVKEEAAIVCGTCSQHNILLSKNHPINHMLIGTLLGKISNALDQMCMPTEMQVTNIVTFIENSRLHHTHLNSVINLQSKIANLSPHKFELKSLIDFASLSYTTVRPGHTSSRKPNILADTIFKKCLILCEVIKSNHFKVYEQILLPPSHILRLLILIESNAFESETQKRAMLDSARIYTKELFIWTSTTKKSLLSMEYAVSLVLHFLYTDVYDDTILDAIYTDDRILVPSKNVNNANQPNKGNNTLVTYQLRPRLLHSDVDKQAVTIRRAFLMINGMIAVNYPSYMKAGIKLDSSKLKMANAWFGKLFVILLCNLP